MTDWLKKHSEIQPYFEWLMKFGMKETMEIALSDYTIIMGKAIKQVNAEVDAAIKQIRMTEE